ncbi:hypothetical protein ZHAS_00016453 [Anopheles sinensis]|uniref:Uncharacterized protein n=1 Tax=Anopheles sinensis TaxID=74873 RepID=A0A084WE24_ANOSI|nr:hypothetical protein ZHAS_00016453 [Anopheles sinensis]
MDRSGKHHQSRGVTVGYKPNHNQVWQVKNKQEPTFKKAPCNVHFSRNPWKLTGIRRILHRRRWDAFPPAHRNSKPNPAPFGGNCRQACLECRAGKWPALWENSTRKNVPCHTS